MLAKLRRRQCLLRKAALAGVSAAQYDLAVCYEPGKEVRRSLSRAYHFYLAAAKGRDSKGQSEPAVVTITELTPDERYGGDKVVPQGGSKGRRIFAIFCWPAYELGCRCGKNSRLALVWYKKAAASGDEEAKRVLRRRGEENVTSTKFEKLG